jgi:hypothetical protein
MIKKKLTFGKNEEKLKIFNFEVRTWYFTFYKIFEYIVNFRFLISRFLRVYSTIIYIHLRKFYRNEFSHIAVNYHISFSLLHYCPYVHLNYIALTMFFIIHRGVISINESIHKIENASDILHFHASCLNKIER